MAKSMLTTPQRFASPRKRKSIAGPLTITFSVVLTLVMVFLMSITATPLRGSNDIHQEQAFRVMVSSFRVKLLTFSQQLSSGNLMSFFQSGARRLGGVQHDEEYIRAVVNEAALKYNISAELIYSVVKVASEFDALYVSDDGRLGLMQIARPDAVRLQVESPFEPAQNVEAGVKVIRELITQENGNWRKVLSRYYLGQDGKRSSRDADRFAADVLSAYDGEMAKRFPKLVG